MSTEKYQPKYEHNMDTEPVEMALTEVIQTLEVTTFGKFQIKKIREMVVEHIAYEKMQLNDPNLYKDVYARGHLNGLLTLADLLDEFTIDPNQQQT